MSKPILKLEWLEHTAWSHSAMIAPGYTVSVTRPRKLSLPQEWRVDDLLGNAFVGLDGPRFATAHEAKIAAERELRKVINRLAVTARTRLR